MKLSNGKREEYRKNLACMEEVTDRLLGHMKGHGYSFRQEITDSNGNFSQRKLCDLVKELLELWAETLRKSTDTAPDTKESLAEPYIRERRELYGLYLYLVMRCSLCEGAYAKAYPYGFVDKERTDFAFLLEQARQLSRRWCVMAGPDGKKRNELYEGYDEHFGFHLYKILMDSEEGTDDNALSPWWKRQNNLDDLTNEGNMKRIYIRHLSGSFQEIRGEETDGTNSAIIYEDDEAYADYECYEYEYEDDDDDDDPYPFPDFETKAEFEAARMEQLAEEYERAEALTTVALNFTCEAEYLEACRRFTALFENAKPEILRDFYQELEKIVNLYLAEQNLAPLTETDKTLDVYSRVFDGPCKQANNYERRLQWEK